MRREAIWSTVTLGEATRALRCMRLWSRRNHRPLPSRRSQKSHPVDRGTRRRRRRNGTAAGRRRWDRTPSGRCIYHMSARGAGAHAGDASRRLVSGVFGCLGVGTDAGKGLAQGGECLLMLDEPAVTNQDALEARSAYCPTVSAHLRSSFQDWLARPLRSSGHSIRVVGIPVKPVKMPRTCGFDTRPLLRPHPGRTHFTGAAMSGCEHDAGDQAAPLVREFRGRAVARHHQSPLSGVTARTSPWRRPVSSATLVERGHERSQRCG